MWWALVGAAGAAAPGHWHPTDLAAQSKTFEATSRALQAVLADRETAAKRIATSLLEYEEALDLLGDAAPVAELTRQNAMEEAFKSHRTQLQSVADGVVADYDAAFRRSIAKAAGSTFEDLQECPATVPQGRSLPGMPSKSAPNPDCQGEDLNARFATAVDADPVLRADLEEILARPWPELTLDAEPQTPIGLGTRWLPFRALVAGVAKDALAEIDTSDGLARIDAASRAREVMSPEETTALMAEVAKIGETTATRRAALGGPIREAAQQALAKRKGEATTSWCANPEALGACTGVSAGPKLLADLISDKRVQKAVP